MPRYYINFQNTNHLAKDDVGIVSPSLEGAWKAALVSAREIMADNIRSATDAPLQAVIITDEGGQEVLHIQAKDILPDPMKG
jgi:hypothetical protein